MTAKLSKTLAPLNGDYSDLFTPKTGHLALDPKKGWKISKTPITSKNREQYFTDLASCLAAEDLSQIQNLDCLISRINEIWCQSKNFLTEPNKNQGIYFSSKVPGYDWLSNYFPTLLLIKHKLYTSSEAAYQDLKIRVISVEESLDAESSAAKAKQKGKRVQQRWEASASEADIQDLNKMKIKIMEGVIHKKFSLNPSLKDALLKTGSLPLVEDTKDAFWGCGADGLGSNSLGKILEKYRNFLISKG